MSEKPIIIQCAREIHEYGGASGVAFYLEKEFKKSGYTVKRFTVENLPFGKYFANKKFKNIIISKIHLFISVIYYSIVGSMVLLFKKNKNNIIICHSDVLIGDIYINHGLHKSILIKNGFMKMFLKNPLHIFLYLREEFRHRFSDHKVIITFSKEDSDELKKYYPIKSEIEIIPNGIDTTKFHVNNEIRDKYRKINNISTEFVLIFVGHEFERKGLDVIIESLKYLDHNVVLWVIGGNDGLITKYSKLAEKFNVKKRVMFFGVQKNINGYINASDAMVLASDIEPWGLVGLEAMSVEKPLISTKTHGVKEYLKDGKNGLFVKREATDIANKIKMIQSNQGLYFQLSKNARKTAKKYDWNYIAKKYINLINRLFSRKNNV